MATGGDTIVRSVRSRESKNESVFSTSIAHSTSVKKKLSLFQSAEVLALTYGALVRQLVADLDDVADVNAQLDTMCVGFFQVEKTNLLYRPDHQSNFTRAIPDKVGGSSPHGGATKLGARPQHLTPEPFPLALSHQFHPKKKNKKNQPTNHRGYNIGCRLVDDFLAKSRAPASACAGFRPAIDAVARGAFRAFLGVTPRVADWNDAGTACSLLLDESPLTDWVELPRELAGLRYQNLLAGAVRGGLEQVGMATRCEFVADALDGGDRTELRVTLLAPPGAEAYPFKDED